MENPAAELRLPVDWRDHTILAICFAVVLGIGFAAWRSVRTSLDLFLSGRSLPAWVTGLAFIAAYPGATEILGMAANSAQYGVYTTPLVLDRRHPGHGLPTTRSARTG